MNGEAQDAERNVDGVLSYRTPVGLVDKYHPREGFEPLIITLQTYEALHSMLGRPEQENRNVITGWSRAASCYAKLGQAYCNDNPWADLMLIQAEQDLIDRRKTVSEAVAEIQKIAIDIPGVSVGKWGTGPVCLAIDSGNAHSRMLALFAVEVDRLVMLLKHAQSLGLIGSRQTAKEIGRFRTYLRQAISLPVQLYSKLCVNGTIIEVTRRDFECNTEALRILRTRLGCDPSHEILTRAMQPNNAPVTNVPRND